MSRISAKEIPSVITDENFKEEVSKAIPIIRVYSLSINPTTVNATSESDQTFTVPGLSTSDVVVVNPPALAAGLGIMWNRVSATDTLQIRFRNFTGVGIDPAAGTWHIYAFRR